MFFFIKNKKFNTVVFDLSNEQYTHIGDSLFYEPIIKSFESLNINISVCVHDSLKKYFELANHKLINKSQIINNDLIIAPFWIYNHYSKKYKEKTIFLDPTNIQINMPITNYFYSNICKELKIRINDDNLFPSKPYFEKYKRFKYSLKNGRKYIIFNDSVDSGVLRITKKMKYKLLLKAKSYKEKGFDILRLGSQKDKLRFPKKLDIEHVDLRGQTDVLDLFFLISNNQVYGTISFDTAIAHISIMYNKKTFILLRRFTKNHKNHIRKFIMPSYITENRKEIKYIT